MPTATMALIPRHIRKMSTWKPGNSKTKVFKSQGKKELGLLLDRLTRETHSIERIKTDPIEFPHRYHDSLDIEVVAFLSAILAYGRVSLFKQILEKVLALMGEKPYRFIETFDPDHERRRFKGIYYRFNRTEDFIALFTLMARVVQRYGSLGSLFISLYKENDPDIGPALTRFVNTFKRESDGPISPGLAYLLPSPEDGSACKRFNLFLRWMVRPNDGVDFGLWKAIPPAKLIIPLDTHIVRIAGYLKLTKRKTPDWKMAKEITEGLKRFDPIDPLKYDFPLCHLGLSGDCPLVADREKCKQCLLLKVCTRGKRLTRIARKNAPETS